MKVEFHPATDQEFAEAIDFYAATDPNLGVRFYGAIIRLFEHICDDAKHYRVFNAPYRHALSEDFLYALIYSETHERIQILAVARLKRQPGYWRGRIK